jgi:hypothetical protein
MNFRPEKLYLGKHANGSNLRIEEWNYDTRAGYELIGSFINLFSAIFFIQIISPIILVYTILGFNGRANIFNVIGLVLGSYFLYDAYNGWLVTNFLHILLSERVINILVYLNAVSVVLHPIFLLFSTVIYNTINITFETEDKCKQVFLGFILAIGFTVVIFTNNTLESNVGWLDKNIQACLERNKTPEPVEVEEPEPVYDDGSFHDNPNFLSDFDHN